MRDFEKVTIAKLQALLAYDPQTGLVSWRPRGLEMFSSEKVCRYWNEQNAGRAITRVDSSGYGCLRSILGRTVYLPLHRIAWVLHYGEWPAGIIDHINGNKLDNRIENLRVVTDAENLSNKSLYRKNCSGVPGVRRKTIRSAWEVTIGDRGRQRRTTTHCFGEAVRLRRSMEAQLGYHPNHGRPSA